MTSAIAALVLLGLAATNAREAGGAVEPPKEVPCAYHVLPPITALVRGAVKQRLRLKADRPACALDEKLGQRIVGVQRVEEPKGEASGAGGPGPQAPPTSQDTGKDRNVVWLTLEEGGVRYSVPGIVLDAKSGLIDFAPIPSSLPTGERDWRLTSATREAYGQVRVGTAEITIEREVQAVTAPDLDVKLVPPSPRIALANRLLAGKFPDRWVIKNLVRVKLPEAVQPVSKAWGIRQTSWGSKVQFEGCDPYSLASVFLTPITAGGACALSGPGQTTIPLVFEVEEGRADPLVVELVYHPVPEGSAEPWLVASLDLAAGAVVAAAPLPMAGALEVTCPLSRVTAKNNTLIAVPEKELRKGECVLVLDQRRLSPRLRQLRPIYGPQTVSVSVRHVGAEADGEATWVFDPSSSETVVSVPLPLPDRDQPSLDPYVIKALVTTGSTGSTQPTSNRNGPATDGYTFAARIRSRGEYGLWSPLRVFATIPVDITGLRFPANPRDLKSSSDSTVYQPTQLRTGLLFGAEPWDYEANSSRWPIPVRALTGLYFFDLTNVSFTPSAVAGVSATVPLVQGPSQLGTTLGLGAFYELDLKDTKPLKTGHRFLITFGFNVFALSSGK